MSRMIRSIHSSLGTAVVLCAFAGVLPGDTSAAFDTKEPGAEQQRRRHHDALTFTQIDVPGATATQATWINNRGQIVGGYVDDVRRHGFLLSDGEFRTLTAPPGAFLESLAFDIDDHGRIVGIYF